MISLAEGCLLPMGTASRGPWRRQTNQELAKTRIEQQYRGPRVTDDATMEMDKMIFAGKSIPTFWQPCAIAD